MRRKHEQKLPQVLKIGERVVTFIGDYPARGTVGYIGEEKDSSGNLRGIVGLEMVRWLEIITCTVCGPSNYTLKLTCLQLNGSITPSAQGCQGEGLVDLDALPPPPPIPHQTYMYTVVFLHFFETKIFALTGSLYTIYSTMKCTLR